MTLNERLQDEAIERAIYLQQYGNGLTDEVLALLREMENSIERKLRNTRGELTRRLLEAKLIDVRRIIAGGNKKLERLLLKRLRELTRIEGYWAAGSLKVSLAELGATAIAVGVARPDIQALEAAINSRPFQGKLLKEWVKEFSEVQARSLRNAVRIGFAEGESIDQIVRRVVGTSRRGYRDGVFGAQRRSIEAIIRTAINHVATYARQEVYTQQADLLKGVQWSSTLDGRTSAVCRARDGKVYPPKEGPRPPAHINCRSTIVPIAKGATALGLPPAARSSIDGYVPADLNYGDWLKGKPRDFVARVLGEKRAKLFLKGELPIDRFVNPRGRSYTLTELENLFPDAWKRAGI